MKKHCCWLLLLISLASLCSCSMVDSRLNMLNTDSDEEKADARMAQVIDAIKDQDKDAIKAIFSKQALSETNDIDAGINYLFNLVKGDIKLWEKDTVGSYEDIEYGKKDILIFSFYTVTTDVGVYKFFLLDHSINTIDPNNAGLYSLRAIKSKDEKTQFTFWEDMQIPGIFIPKTNSSK